MDDCECLDVFLREEFDPEWDATVKAYPEFKRKKEMVMTELKDSGERRTFDSGAQRDRGELKPRPDLISPHTNMREGMIFALGAEKYDTRNWEKGMPISECLASAQRHIEQWKRGDTDEDHLAQARWNLGAIIHYEEEIKAGRMDPAIDNMPRYDQQSSSYIQVPFVSSIMPLPITASEDTPRMWATVPAPKVTIKPHSPDDQDCADLLTAALAYTPKVYIAGPMRGIPKYNFPAFDAARDRWETWGYDVISPADLDRDSGIDPADPDAPKWDGDIRAVIERDIMAILHLLRSDSTDAIALLPGWENSKGAAVEVALGKLLDLGFVDAETGHYKEV